MIIAHTYGAATVGPAIAATVAWSFLSGATETVLAVVVAAGGATVHILRLRAVPDVSLIHPKRF